MITIERPLRLNFQASPERLARLPEQPAFAALAASKKKDPEAKAKEEAMGRAWQAQIAAALAGLPDTVYKDRGGFEVLLAAAAKAVPRGIPAAGAQGHPGRARRARRDRRDLQRQGRLPRAGP